jgi:hypothetical protein
MVKKKKSVEEVKSDDKKLEDLKTTPVKNVTEEDPISKLKNTKVKNLGEDKKLEELKNTSVKDVQSIEKLEELKETQVKDLGTGLDVNEQKAPPKLSDIPEDKRPLIINNIKVQSENIANGILSLRSFRERIDYIIKVLNLSGLQKEIAPRVVSYNPIEHSIANFIAAKGGLGEALKNMVPAPTLIAYDCYHGYLNLCNELDEKPTYEGDFPFIDEDYVNSLIARIDNLLLNPVSAKENHENWMKDRIDQGWKFGKVKSSEKKTHPSLIDYDELPDGEKRKGELFINTVNKYKNPYSYPKQESKDVEPFSDAANVNDLEIALPVGRYKRNGVNINHASQLNPVQLVDFIKSLMDNLISDYIQFFFKYFKGSDLNLFYRYNDNQIKPIELIGLSLRATYQNLVDAKNLFGYTYQYYK